MIEITLAPHELTMAAIQGAVRQAEALALGLADRHGFTGSGWDVHCEGACGEMAFAKAVNRYWSGSVNTFKRGGDVGAVQVRTRSQHHYELIVRPDDRSEDVFVLVTGTAPSFRVHGWITGAAAKRIEYVRTHGGRPPAFFVPQTALNAIDP